MKALLKELKTICNDHPLTEKVLVVNAYAIGEQILQAFTKAGNHAINVKIATVQDLAMEVVFLHEEDQREPITRQVGDQLVYSLLKTLQNENKLQYFSGLEVTPHFSHGIYRTLEALRLAGYTKETLEPDKFLAVQKGQDMKNLLDAYEEELSRYRLMDAADVYKQAMQWAKPSDHVMILQPDLAFSYLEEKFLQKISPKTVHSLPLEPVYGVARPERPGLRAVSEGEPTPFSYLYDLDKLDSKPSLDLFTAKTEEQELKEVLHKIKHASHRFDESVILYTSGDAYVAAMHRLSERQGIPVTFGDGLPVTFTNPGKLAAAYLRWIKNRYSVQGFIGMMNEGLFQFEDSAPSRTRIASLLRDCQIGWDKHRYVTRLESERKQTEIAAGQAPDKEVKTRYEKRIEELRWLKQWFTKFFKKLPETVEPMSEKEVWGGLLHLISEHAKTGSALDEAAKSALLEAVESILPYAQDSLMLYEAVQKVEDLLSSIRINRSGPKPGHLHITGYKHGMYIARGNVFVVGLDNRKFPGASNEDPLLLDQERTQLSESLPLLREKGKENRYAMLQTLAASNGSVTVSYCHVDINDNRAINPSHLFLQCYRMKTGKKEANYKDMQNDLPKPITSPEHFEKKDFWMDKLLDERRLAISDSILSIFPNATYGLYADDQRKKDSFTEFDGLVAIEGDMFDPRKNREKRMSAGKLEMLAKCPYSYFLKEVLRIEPVDDMTYDPNRWLDPASRGRLLHHIFELFYKRLQEKGEKPSVTEHEQEIREIANRLIKEEREILPPPDDRVFNREVDDILACCTIFLKEEESHAADYEPLHFEYAFGIGDADPAEITLPSKETVRLSGIVDRVDRSQDGRYHIIDYKTGSTYGYSENKHFQGGRQLQHMIYAAAIEHHLRLTDGEVEESAYFFPTRKGNGKRFVRRQDEVLRTNGLAILEQLIDIIKHGHFTMTDDVNDCKFCDFQAVCRRHFYDKDTFEAKHMDPDAEGVKRFKGVRSYD